ncbi:adenosylcobalamin-dependent ribonucleoside-diphosphate reductase [Methanobacterium paludis]|uniref:adenosylcobalamin-dependent ribonucleoside-diphosphate reductase n=1 Tax=Methanobacterium paludis (strain DSM 25820 / JCM 18151 / SWAN1) TaxID=868131 RepID=UPI001D12C832|nr:adenosylcobalamin-dependent ribonucleoside-diphosphate reductase [Methanobacterium paludis]
MSLNARKILQKKYLIRDVDGNITETPSELFRRVAREIAKIDRLYDHDADVEKTEEEFFNVMSCFEFLPNSPTLMNAGTSINQLSACFVLPVGDSMGEIFDALKYMALIHKSGGGVGFSFSDLRPQGDIVKSTKGIASGPLSFMRIFDVATDVVKQGGKRRGANMGILNIKHPDILEFIAAKEQEGFLSNFNLSVAVDDEFMQKVEDDEEYELINPRNNEAVTRLRALEVFNSVVEKAWKSGDPGIIFLDEINRKNPTKGAGKIEATNPCGEQPLLPYESCNLGSINLVKMVKNGKINWDKLRNIIRTAVHFLDNVIDANNFPIHQIEVQTLKNRKIGLGIMGFAEMLIMLNVPYDSQEAIKIAEELMSFIETTSRGVSAELGRLRGSFPDFNGSIWDFKGYGAMRNATITTIAPTGTLSIIANVTSSIEPLFAVSFIRKVMEGTELIEVNPLFEKIAKDEGFYSTELMMSIVKRGSIQDILDIPEDTRRLFVTAHDIDPQWHVRMQAAFQRHVDNAVSKTVNLPHAASINDVKKVFLLAHKLKCKGITVYRYASKKKQVLYINKDSQDGNGEKYFCVDLEYAGGCPKIHCPD